MVAVGKLGWVAALLWACSAQRPKATRSNEPRLATNRTPAASVSAVPTTASTPRTAGAALATLRVGTSGDYAPFSWRDPAGAATGFDVELAEQLARDLGVGVTWVPFTWPSLAQRLAAQEFDLVMSGLTWLPARDVSGYLSRAVARGGPCVLGVRSAPRVAVNRGGVLEAWARTHFGNRELIVVDDNRSLPSLLATAKVGAIVTDSFERKAFARPEWATHCEAPLLRKVYWVSPARAAELGARIDNWIRDNGSRVQAAQERWFGERQRLDATTHLVDLLARRFAFMPLVAAIKAAKNLPLEDLAREREVLEAMRVSASRFALPERRVLDLFALLIELSKDVQRRQSEPSPLDLSKQIRPALDQLGERIFQALSEAREAHQLAQLTLPDLELLSPWLGEKERQRLLVVLRAVDAR